MKYLLDTNACISYLNNPASKVRVQLGLLKPSDIVLCSVVEAELYYGVMKSSKPDENREKLEFFLKLFLVVYEPRWQKQERQLDRMISKLLQ